MIHWSAQWFHTGGVCSRGGRALLYASRARRGSALEQVGSADGQAGGARCAGQVRPRTVGSGEASVREEPTGAAMYDRPGAGSVMLMLLSLERNRSGVSRAGWKYRFCGIMWDDGRS